MGIETSVAKRKGKEFGEVEKEKNPILNNTNTRGGKKAARGRHIKKTAVVSPVQKLYDTCKDVFSIGGPGVVPAPDKIEKLRAVLDVITPEDVGLHPEMPYFRLPVAGRAPPIRYLHIHECNKFSIGIFCFPPSGVIPLHNHPGMTVFSKLLFGKMHIKSYDWVDEDSVNGSAVVNPSEVRLAKVKIDSDFTAPCNPCILYPVDGGNMHCFTAATACAVLDVLGPPYSDPEGRHCTYYNDFPFANFSVDGVSLPEEEREGYAWLQERTKQPDDFKMVGELYRGPKIVKK
ncbi:Protein C10orf22, putative [Ricinus communis]|uniref:cysteine dioxygenase n=1 Tax=Ricinus communis TaxID=3988 RepID=B9RUN4_RICCO|nr:Protein C10orf22, putative [Ricinus communis]